MYTECNRIHSESCFRSLNPVTLEHSLLLTYSRSILYHLNIEFRSSFLVYIIFIMAMSSYWQTNKRRLILTQFACVQMNHDLLVSFSFSANPMNFHSKQFEAEKCYTQKKTSKQASKRTNRCNKPIIVLKMQTPFPYIFDDLLNLVVNNSKRCKAQSYAILLCLEMHPLNAYEQQRERESMWYKCCLNFPTTQHNARGKYAHAHNTCLCEWINNHR